MSQNPHYRNEGLVLKSTRPTSPAAALWLIEAAADARRDRLAAVTGDAPPLPAGALIENGRIVLTGQGSGRCRCGRTISRTRQFCRACAIAAGAAGVQQAIGGQA